MSISNKFINLCSKAKDILSKSPMDIKLAACVLRNGKICGTGFNTDNRSTINGKTMPCIHCEMSAIMSFISSTNNIVKYKPRKLCSLRPEQNL